MGLAEHASPLQYPNQGGIPNMFAQILAATNRSIAVGPAAAASRVPSLRKDIQFSVLLTQTGALNKHWGVHHMTITLRPGTAADAAACGPICYEAFKAVAEAHNF